MMAEVATPLSGMQFIPLYLQFEVTLAGPSLSFYVSSFSVRPSVPHRKHNGTPNPEDDEEGPEGSESKKAPRRLLPSLLARHWEKGKRRKRKEVVER